MSNRTVQNRTPSFQHPRLILKDGGGWVSESFPVLFLYFCRANESPEKLVLPNRAFTKTDYYIIHKGHGSLRSREIKEKHERELEAALEKQYSLIVIEPRILGDEAIRWIKFGNFLHKSAVLTCLGSLVLLPFIPRYMIPLPLGLFGTACAFVYNVSWQFDPCCNYQVDWNGQELGNIPSHELSARSPVVLVRKNDIYRKILHTMLAAIVVGCFSWRFYKLYH